MRHRRLALITAAAIAVAPFTPVPAYAAAVPARGVAPADAPTATVVKQVFTDVDGDGTRDTVTLTYLGSNRFELAATTTKGKTSSVRFTSAVDPYQGPAGSAWYGASALDGRKGSELIVKRNTSDSTWGTTLSVFTWRSGKLVAEKPPATPTGKVWRVNDDGSPALGYTFFTKHGHRYVDASRLVYRTNKPWKGKVTRSVWRNGKWVKLYTHTATAAKQALWGEVGIGGPRLLLHAVKVDVNGDGKLDLVRVYQEKLVNHYLVTVKTGKTITSATYSTDGGNGFVGAAAIDGNPGAELIFQTEAETPLWKVFTWRSGKLASLPGPIVREGTSVGVWAGAGDETATNVTVGVEDGRHHVTESWIAADENIAHVKTWVWQANGWTTVSDWTETTLTAEQLAAFHRGFTATDLVTP